MAHEYLVHKDICLTDVINAGVTMSPATVVEWLEELTHYGPDEIIDWIDDKEFRHFAHRTGLTPQLVEAGFIEIVEPGLFKIGTFFQDLDSENIYLLSQVNPGMVCLIRLDTGNRWTDPVSVNFVNRITADEMDMIQTSLYLKRISPPLITIV